MSKKNKYSFPKNVLPLYEYDEDRTNGLKLVVCWNEKRHSIDTFRFDGTSDMPIDIYFHDFQGKNLKKL